MTIGEVDVVGVISDRMHLHNIQRLGFGSRQYGQRISLRIGLGVIHALVDAICTAAIVAQLAKRNLL